jgi:hypothetical protein
MHMPDFSWNRSPRHSDEPACVEEAWRRAGRYLVLGAAWLSCAGCAGLLPHAREETQTPWHTYAEAQTMFSRIVPGTTTLSELKALGVDPEQTSNIAILNHADLLRRLVPVPIFDVALLDPGLAKCATTPRRCFGYEIEQKHLDRNRTGNFWLDVLNFRRTVDVIGWEFDAIVVVQDDRVVFKQWSGKPNIRQVERQHTPLGPLQGVGPSLLSR